MSGLLMFTFGYGTIATVFLLCLFSYHRGQETPERRFRRADKFAKHVDLALTPEVLDLVADRLRRRTLASAVTGTMLFGLVGCGWYWAMEHRRDLEDQASLLFVIAPGVIGVVSAAFTESAGHVFDLHRIRLAPGPRVVRLDAFALGDAVPPALTWLSRAAVLLPLGAILAAVAEDDVRPLWCVVAVLATLASVPLVEACQRRVLNGPQHAVSPHATAFDDAFRAQAALPLTGVPLAVGYVAGAAVLWPVFEHATVAHPLSDTLYFAWAAAGLCVMLAEGAVNLRPVRRRYRSRLPQEAPARC